MRRNEDADASSDARLSRDEAGTFEAEDHLVDRRWADAEMALHVGFGWRPVEHVRIDIDKGQILALLFGEAMRAGAARGA